MNELIKYLVESILTEDIKKTVVVYGGRFQPFHRGHFATYQHLVNQFGGDNVYIGTSDVTDNDKSPFSFAEKKAIMMKMFGIPSNKIVKVKNNYAPLEILDNFNEKTTAFVTAVGEKDAGRLGGKYFKKWRKGDVTKSYPDAGYVYISPAQPNAISGTDVRNWLSKGSDEEKKKKFSKVYPKFDAGVFKLITDKLKKLKSETVKGRTIDDILNEAVGSREIILEGGAYGHMSHPFDIDMNLTFGDLKNIVKSALTGKLELTREKTDGQALAVSWVNGRLVAARNKSHLKNSGKDAMGVQDVVSKFAGRGAVSDAFSFAIKDLESAIRGLSDKDKKTIFKDGKCFMNCEIIYPANTNVIPYGTSLLVFHGTMEYDKDGNAVGENAAAGSKLDSMVKKINANIQSKFTIQGPPITQLPVTKDLKSKQSAYLAKIAKLQSEYGLTDKDGVADYHQAFWEEFVDKGAPKLDPQQKIGLVKRWAFGDKSFAIRNIADEKIKSWAEKTDKENLQKITKDNIAKFESIFLGVGADVLSFMTSVLVVNPDAAKQTLVKQLESTITSIRSSNNPSAIEKLETELARLEDLGGADKIVPIEGIVFSYKGNTYKLTGAFAALNQILGIMKYSR